MFNINMKISSFLKVLHLAVAQQGPGHAEKLSFPHREVLSILCHLCLQWMRQLADLRPVTDRFEEKCPEYNTAKLFNHHFSLTISLMCVFSRASQIWESEYWSQGSKLDLWEHKKSPIGLNMMTTSHLWEVLMLHSFASAGKGQLWL